MRLDSNQYKLDKYSSKETILACGIEKEFTITSPQDPEALQKLNQFLKDNTGQFIFGHIAYEAKDLFDVSKTTNRSFIKVPCISFFVPEYVIEIAFETAIIHKSKLEVDELKLLIRESEHDKKVINHLTKTGLHTVDKDTYMGHVRSLLDHIHRGDIYEVNYCQALHYNNITLDPHELYYKMQENSSAPFGAFYRFNDIYLNCASPERFLAKRGSKLICQPIKGTNRRMEDPVENENQQRRLKSSLKERSENVMIVDLMRNDMSKICNAGSVEVEELFGIYAFRHVNQMISTVVGEVDENINFAEVMEALFPMGSMTGAPKLSALQLIDELEPFQRGLFSGTVGYIDPQGNWDWNVVIRSIIYDDNNHLASISAGGAITALSDPEEEYEESLLKMESLILMINDK